MLVADIYNKEGLDEQTLNNIKEFNLFNPTKEEFYDLFNQAGFIDINVDTKDTWICVTGKK